MFASITPQRKKKSSVVSFYASEILKKKIPCVVSCALSIYFSRDDDSRSDNSREVLDTKVMWVCSGERLLPSRLPIG